MRSSNVVGMSLAVVDGDRVVWADGLGRADDGTKVAASPRTIYRAGGISALLTITAALQLVDAGLIDLDSPVRKYLPGFKVRPRFPGAREILVRDLMTHHSGLPHTVNKGSRGTRPGSFTELVDALQEESPLLPPGTAFSPSEAAVTLLGLIVQTVAQRDFVPYMRQTLLAPLGMENAGFAVERERSNFGARGHRKGKSEEEPGLRDVPAVGLNASVLDLARFASMTLGGGRLGDREFLRPATAAEMLRPQNANVPMAFDMRVGFGWIGWAFLGLSFPGAGPVWHMSGDTLDFHSMILVLPSQGLAVVVMANSAGSEAAVSRVAEETMVAALQAKSGWRRPEPLMPQPDGPELSESELAAWEGDWATVTGYVRIFRKGDSLRCAAFGRTFNLVPREDGRLAVRLKLAGLIPVSLGPFERMGLSREIVDGREILVAEADGTRMVAGERVRPAPVSAAWAGRLGHYVVTNPGTDLLLVEESELKIERGVLLVEFEMPRLTGDLRIRLPLVPLSDDEAVLGGIGTGLGDMFRVVTLPDGISGLRYSGYLLGLKKR
jgi:CubicO group peptidase (beta-lactamase class C family)